MVVENSELIKDMNIWKFNERGSAMLNNWKRKFLVCFVLSSVILCAGAAHADFSQRLNYQGRLVDSNGVPLADGSYSMTFEIYDDATAGSVVWDQTIAAVTVVDGLFSELLGSVADPLSAVNWNQNLWLQVTVGGTAYTPRQQLTGGVYALAVPEGSIGTAHLANDSVTSAKILNGEIVAADVNTASIQVRVSDTCAAGSSIRVISSTGTVTCETDDDNQCEDQACSKILIDGTTASYTLDTISSGSAPATELYWGNRMLLNSNTTFGGEISGTYGALAISCTDCLNATEIADDYVLNTSDTMSGSLGVGTTLSVGTNLTVTGTVDSGQGATEIYLMNQNLRTTDSVTHVNVTSTGNFIGDLKVDDTRAVNDAPTAFDYEVSFDFKDRTAVGVGGSGTYSGMMTFAPWGDNSGDASHQLNFNEGGIFWRQGQPDAGAWDSWYQIGYNENLDDRYVNDTGDTMSGDLVMSGAALDFNEVVAEKVLLYGAAGAAGTYSIGVESSTQYFKTGGVYRWYVAENADGGASENMELDADSLNFNNKETIGYGDSWLRLNNNSDYTSGIYTPGGLRADSWLRSNYLQNISGTEAIRMTDAYLRVNEGKTFTGGTWFGGMIYNSPYLGIGSNGGTTTSDVYITGTYDGTNDIAIDGDAGTITMSGELLAGGIRTPSSGYSTGAPMDVGAVATDYPGNSGWAGSWNSNILLSGLNSTSISFHDSGASVATLRYTGNNFYVGENVGWGVSNLTVGGTIYGTLNASSVCYVTGSFAINGSTNSCNSGYCAMGIIDDSTKKLMASGDYNQRGVTQFATGRLLCCRCAF